MEIQFVTSAIYLLARKGEIETSVCFIDPTQHHDLYFRWRTCYWDHHTACRLNFLLAAHQALISHSMAFLDIGFACATGRIQK